MSFGKNIVSDHDGAWAATERPWASREICTLTPGNAATYYAIPDASPRAGYRVSMGLGQHQSVSLSIYSSTVTYVFTLAIAELCTIASLVMHDLQHREEERKGELLRIVSSSLKSYRCRRWSKNRVRL